GQRHRAQARAGRRGRRGRRGGGAPQVGRHPPVPLEMRWPRPRWTGPSFLARAAAAFEYRGLTLRLGRWMHSGAGLLGEQEQRRMRFRSIVLLGVFSLVFSLVGCGSDDGEGGEGGSGGVIGAGGSGG